jgi:hypothetical protein
MPVLPELEPLLARIRSAGAPDHAKPLAERRDQVHAGIEMQQAHMVEPVPAAPHVDHRVSVDGGANSGELGLDPRRLSVGGVSSGANRRRQR